MQFQGTLINQTREKGEKPNSGCNFGSFGPNMDPQFLFVGFTSTRY